MPAFPHPRPGRHFLSVLALVIGGCANPAAEAPEQAAPTPPWFVDATQSRRLEFMHDAGKGGKYFMPEMTGSGAALFDFDNDGRLDVLLLQNAGPGSGATHRLFHQEGDGQFKDVSAGSGLDVDGYGQGVAIGDVNNDGRPDVLITEYGRVRLFLNQGNGRFQDVSAAAGVANTGWGTSAAFFDYDRDGWLDLVVVNYIIYDPSRWCASTSGRQDYCGPKGFKGSVTRLFHNETGAAGKPVRFRDVTAEAGLDKAPGPGLGVYCADFDGDGWPDVFVTNDGKPNHLWINQKNGSFKEEAVERGIAFNCLGNAEANMGIAVGDVDGDGLFDLFVTHLASERNTLWRQSPRGQFEDRTAAFGLTGSRWRGTGFGTLMADFDHDGAIDLAVVNGRVERDPARGATPGDFWSDYAERNQLFRNDGRGRFDDVSLSSPELCNVPGVWRGLAAGDLDNDGALDLVVTRVAGPARLYRNVAPKQGHWLTVRAIDPALRRDALGAEVSVIAGGRRWRQTLSLSASYLCSNDPRLHFGLGSAARVDAIRVLWPDGLDEEFAGSLDRALVLERGQGRAVTSRRDFQEHHADAGK